jgi:hypothetical protein
MPYEVSRPGPQTWNIAPNHEHRCSVAEEIGSPGGLLCPVIVNWARSLLPFAPLHALPRGGRLQHGANLSRSKAMVSREHRRKNNGSNVAQRCRMLLLKRCTRSHRAPGHCSWHRLLTLFAERSVRTRNVAQRFKLSQPGLSEMRPLPEWFSTMHLHAIFRPLFSSHELNVASIPSRIYTRPWS